MTVASLNCPGVAETEAAERHHGERPITSSRVLGLLSRETRAEMLVGTNLLQVCIICTRGTLSIVGQGVFQENRRVDWSYPGGLNSKTSEVGIPREETY
jgi:hypothetical protein